MPRYAVLGATGNTGRAIVEVLLAQSPENHVHVYCRSKEKLLRLIPAAATSQVRIFEGALSDVTLITECLRGSNAAFLAVAIADNMPGCTVSRDAAHTVVDALRSLSAQEDQQAKIPRLVVLSSASLEPSFSDDVPPLIHRVLDTCVSHLYKDLAEAEAYLRAESGWVSSVFVKPGGLVHDRQRGHEISTTTAKTPLSYLDLAAGMIEVADSDAGQYDMKNVSVIGTADGVAFPWAGVYYALTGLLYHFFPWTYYYLGDYRHSWKA